MSKSPKYTTASLTGAQLAELERLRQERERERQRREAEARRRQEEAARAQALAQVRKQAEAVQAAVLEVLTEAQEGDITLSGAAAARDLLGRLASASAVGDLPQASALYAQAEQARTALEDDFDRQLDQLDRVRLVYQAVTRALGGAGLRLLPQTQQAAGISVSVQAERGDGGLIEIAVVPDGPDHVQLEYHADGTDFVVSQTADGRSAECPDTEELIERFHGELKALDVDTGELRWEGKPETRPVLKEAKLLPRSGARYQEHG